MRNAGWPTALTVELLGAGCEKRVAERNGQDIQQMHYLVPGTLLLLYLVNPTLRVELMLYKPAI